MYYTLNPFTGKLWASESPMAARDSVAAMLVDAQSVGRLGEVSQFLDHKKMVTLLRPAVLDQPLDFPLG